MSMGMRILCPLTGWFLRPSSLKLEMSTVLLDLHLTTSIGCLTLALTKVQLKYLWKYMQGSFVEITTNYQLMHCINLGD